MTNSAPDHLGARTIRVATPADAPSIQAIYAPFCAADSPVSFELAAPSVEEMRGRIESTQKMFPWLVAEGPDGQILGYAYAGLHMHRPAYKWSVNVSIYLAPEARRKGLGVQLYKKLFAVLRKLGYYNAYAGITLPNDASVGLHRLLYFIEVGVYERVGYKCDQWLDVAWWALSLQDHIDAPAEPMSFAQFMSDRAALAFIQEAT